MRSALSRFQIFLSGFRKSSVDEDGVVKTLHLLRHCKLNVITTYFSTPHSIKFAFLECEAFYLAIIKFTFTRLLMKTITRNNKDNLSEAAKCFHTASHPVALTGAGISVGSGIADFRSPGGLWTFFSPDEYATLDVFLHDPEKAWRLYRKLGKELLGKKPNKGHHVLADFEKNGLLNGLITQNVDGLHQVAGNKVVLEIHGDHQRLHCLQCGNTIPVIETHYDMKEVPECRSCLYPLKPNIVLFGEPVKSLEKIQNLISACDLLLVIGTSAKVFPAAGIPERVRQQGGIIYEFNREQVLSPPGFSGHNPLSDYFFEGDLGVTLPLFGDAVLNNS